jgi:hypothetical protein
MLTLCGHRFLVFVLALVSWSIFFDFQEGLSVIPMLLLLLRRRRALLWLPQR